MSSKIGDIIRNRREDLGLDLSICSSQLKIQKKYLEGIENNDYSMFENFYQAIGFVQNYLEFLNLSAVTLIPRWRKEVLDYFKGDDKYKENYYKPKKKRKVNIILTADKLINFSLIFIFIGFLSYIFYTYQQTMSAPLLDITSPENNHITEQDIVDIFGKTDKDAELKLNNDKITIHTDGNFSTSIKLAEGINTFKFSSKNPFNKETVKILTIIYRPKKIEIYNPPVESSKVIDTTEPKSTIPSSLPAKQLN
jgi:cytoskeletal protein RodZ